MKYIAEINTAWPKCNFEKLGEYAEFWEAYMYLANELDIHHLDKWKAESNDPPYRFVVKGASGMSYLLAQIRVVKTAKDALKDRILEQIKYITAQEKMLSDMVNQLVVMKDEDDQYENS